MKMSLRDKITLTLCRFMDVPSISNAELYAVQTELFARRMRGSELARCRVPESASKAATLFEEHRNAALDIEERWIEPIGVEKELT